MKMFDYQCLNCEGIYAAWEDELHCPDCGSTNRTKLVSAPRILEKKQPYDYIGKHRTDEPIKSFVPKSYKGRKDG